MTDASERWDVPALDRELQRLLDQPAAATEVDARGETALERVSRQLLWECHRRLIVDRNVNSDASELTSGERFAREASLFSTALADLLPLGALLNVLEKRHASATVVVYSSVYDAVDTGMRALAVADVGGALRAWSGSGDGAGFAPAVLAHREPFAQRLLQQAAAQFAQAAALVNEDERAELRAVLRGDYLEPAYRTGSELQRDRARQLGAALDLLLAPATQPPARRHKPPPRPPLATPTRRVVAPAAQLEQSKRSVPLILALSGLLIALLTVGILTFPGFRRGEVVTASMPVAAVSTPQIVVFDEQTAVPTTTPTARPTATASPTARPTATSEPEPRVAAFEPAELYVGSLPVELRLRGSDLDQVAAVQLLAQGRQPIPLEVLETSSAELLLRLGTLPEPVAGAVEARLAVDGQVAETPPIVLRDFKSLRIVSGVRQKYAYTSRILSDGGGSYTTIHDNTDATSAPVAPLRNGEQVELLRDDVEGWYSVRIRAANDPAQSGKTGWVERWLVDDAGAPQQPEPTAIPTPRATATPLPTATLLPTTPPQPTPRPQPTDRPAPRPTIPPPRSFGAEVLASFPGSGSSGGRDSCVQGLVRDRRGAGVGAAAIAVNNGDAEIGTLTNGAGEYRICGLGDSTWSVLLRFVPGQPPLAREAVATVYVNGGGEQVAVVNFSER